MQPSPNQPVTVMVLTSSTGSGHDMRAKAFRDWALRLYPNAVNVHIEHIIENGSALGAFGVNLYNAIQRRWPALHNLYFFIVELFTLLHARRVTYGGRFYRNRLRAVRPDIILSVHDSTNKGYFEDARRVLGPNVRCVTYCGEFSGGYGFSRNWVNPSADLFIARTHPSLEFAIRCGMPRAKTAVFHKFLPPSAFTPPIPTPQLPAERAALGLHPHRFTLFLATGGFGANHHIPFLNALRPLQTHLQVIVVCGRNQAVFERVSKWKAHNPLFPIYIEGYSNRVADFLQLSHAVVTRGGANTTMEALHFQCPVLYDGLGGLMPQEYCTIRYFDQHNAARVLHRPSDLRFFLKDWCHFSDHYLSTRATLSRMNPHELPHSLLQMVLNH